MEERLRRALQHELGARVDGARSVRGGDINQAFEVSLVDGRRVFVKTHPAPQPAMFGREAAGLRWLAEPQALRVPRVLAVDDGDRGAGSTAGSPAFLALEWIDHAASGGADPERLGRGLAALHRSGAPHFGLGYDNYIATLLQRNPPTDAWPVFYVEQRLLPLLAQAVDAGHVAAGMRTRLERVLARAELLCGPPEPPARLHGDLWGGNVLADERGAPVLIDPAVYGGHREIDLAMMQLFGGFGPRCFAAYDEVYPRAPEHARRLPFYQLYPLLVHVNLFGECYVANLESALNQIAA